MFVRSMKVRLGQMVRDRKGSVAMIFALGAIPVLGFVGLAIDYGSAVRIKTQLKSSLDAAVLAGINDQIKNVDPSATIHAFMTGKFDGTGYTPTVSVTSNTGNGTLSATATITKVNAFMKLLGVSTTNIQAKSTVMVGAGGGKFEVAIAFDTTGSMAGTKLTAAQAAANQLIDTLFAVPGSSSLNTNVKVGLVPFAAYVNVGMQYRTASWISGANDYSVPSSGCWDTYPNATYSNPIERSGTCYSDGRPYTCTWTDWTVDWGQPVQQCGSWTTDYVWSGCVGSQKASQDAKDVVNGSDKVPAMLNTFCPAPMIRLTNDKTGLKSAVDAMTADGETYIAPGLLWGWRLLSPDKHAPFQDGAEYGAAKKILILLTDGANTHSAQYSNGDHEGGDVTAANAKVLETCQNIKDKEIQVYTILFDVTDSTIQSVLAQCSSGPPYYYNAQTVGDLQGAFASIGSQLTGARLIE